MLFYSYHSVPVIKSDVGDCHGKAEAVCWRRCCGCHVPGALEAAETATLGPGALVLEVLWNAGDEWDKYPLVN